jgi:POT family proton-dependent oligopeptide transporter
MMALYFFSVGIGTAMSGVLAKYYSTDREAAYFGVNGLAVIVIGMAVFALSPWIARRMEGVH